MLKTNRLYELYKLQLKILLFTLPLALLGITFWFGGELLTKQLLSRPYQALDKLQADLQFTIKLKLNTTVVAREIDKEEEFTHVELKTINSRLKKIKFELPIQNYNLEEASLIQQLAIFENPKEISKNIKLIAQFPVTLQLIKVEIYKQQKFSKVVVMAVNSLVTELEFEFPVTDIDMIESIITQELEISRQNMRKLVRYQIHTDSHELPQPTSFNPQRLAAGWDKG